MSNSFKTAILIFGLIALFVYIGDLIDNEQGAFIGLCVAGAMSFFSYWFSDKMVLSAYKGRQISSRDNPELYNIVNNLAQRAGLPMPKIYIIPEQQPNAFATGRNPQNAAVACTEGLLKLMDKNELSGVLGHELGHIKHHDILIGTIAATFAGAITNISRIFGTSSSNSKRNNAPLAILFAPIAALIMQMSISRKREFMADKAGAEFSGNPLYLRDALQKLETYSRSIPLKNTSKPATANMFIINPFAGISGLSRLFSTHPKTSERIRELEKMAALH